jgi:hypothetical protein
VIVRILTGDVVTELRGLTLVARLMPQPGSFRCRYVLLRFMARSCGRSDGEGSAECAGDSGKRDTARSVGTVFDGRDHGLA